MGFPVQPVASSLPRSYAPVRPQAPRLDFPSTPADVFNPSCSTPAEAPLLASVAEPPKVLPELLPQAAPQPTAIQAEDGWLLAGQTAPLVAVSKLAAVDSPAPAQPALANHPGVELHNHLLGIVDTNYFVNKMAGGSPRLLLERIHTLFKNHPALQTEAPEIARLLSESHEQGAPHELQHRKLYKVLNRLLTASPRTPFDGVYTPRDELIKHFLEVTPQQMSALVKSSGLSSGESQRLFQAFAQGGSNDSTLKSIAQAGPKAWIERAGLDPEQAQTLSDQLINQRYENFVTDSIRVLEKDGIHYSEQSISLNKLQTRLSPELMGRVQARLEQEGLHNELRYLAMVATTHLADQGASPTSGLPPKLKAGLEKVVRRADVMGIDIASPEKEPFTPQGMKNFDEMYDLLKEAAQERGRPLVLRPHVGEGYPEMPEGSTGFHRYEVALNGETQSPAHFDTAQLNLETLISHLESRGYNSQKAEQDGVIIRFGHATHVTPQQVERMKRLGIYAEANLSSNVQTGALQPLGPGQDLLENHPLLSLLYNQVPTLLSTDAHGVMHTTLTREYEQADRLIRLFERNKISIDLGDRHVYYRDLSPDERQRFNPAHLRQWAEDYGQAVRACDQHDAARTA